MKKSITVVLAILSLLLTVTQGLSQVLFSENFDYTSGINITSSAGGWSAFSSGGLTPIKVFTPGLTYAGYPNSNIGNAISLASVAGEDVAHAQSSTTLSTGESIYAGFLIQPSSGSTGDLLFNFNGNGGACVGDAGFGFRSSLGSLQFGLDNGSTMAFSPTNYSFNQVFLIIVEYNTSAKSYSLFINPSLSGTKPTADLTVTHSCTAMTSVTEVRFYQNLLGGAAIVDGLRVSKTWSEVVGAASGGSGLLRDENFEYTAGNSISTFSSWTSCCGTAQVNAGSIAYNSYGSSGLGNSLSLSASAEATLNFTPVSSGSIYVGFLLNANMLRAYFDGNTCGSFQSFSSGLPTIVGGANSNFVVVELDISNRFYYYYIAPTMGGTKPSPSSSYPGSWSGSCITNVNSVIFDAQSNVTVDGIRISTSWSDIVAIENPIAQPTTFTSANRTSSSIDLSYTVAPDLPTGYLVVRKSGGASTGTPVDNSTYTSGSTLGDGTVVYSGASSSFTDNTSVAAETNYYYTIYSMNSGGGTTKYLTTSPLTGNAYSLSVEPSGTPSFSASSPSTSQVDLSFTAASALTNADGYLIYRSTQAISSLSFVSDGVAPNTFVLPAGVTLLSNVTNTATTSLSETSLSANTSYYYVIVPYNFDGTNNVTYNYYTTNLISVTGLTRTSSPLALAATSPTSAGFTATWNAVSGATSYQLDVATTSNFGADIVSNYNNLSVNGTSQSVTGLNPNTTYYYRVRADNGAGPSTSSNTISQLTCTLAPVAQAATGISKNGFTANWDAVTGATQYYLDISTSPAFSTIIEFQSAAPIIGTSYTFSSASAGTTFYYRVRSANTAGESSNSNTISLITITDAPVAIGATFITKTSFTANWNATTGASEYRIDVSQDDFNSLLASYNNLLVSGTSQNVTGLNEGIIYQYRVRAVNASGTSASSNSISVLTAPPIPTAQAATSVSTAGFTANWSTVSGASEYLLYVTSNSTFITGYAPKTLTTNSETISGLQPNTAYQYYVKATSTSGTSEASSTISVTTLPTAPQNPSANAITQTSFNALWNAVTGIGEYLLDVSSDNFATTVGAYGNLVVNGTSQNVTGLVAGSSYKFRVRAKNVSGPSDNSTEVLVPLVPSNPASLPASGYTKAGGFQANWSAATGASSYLIDVSLQNNFASFVTGYNAKQISGDLTTETINGLQQGTTYFYRVRAQNSSGQSDYSSTITAVTIPATPTNLAVPSKASGQFIGTWSRSQGATYYEVEVSTIESDFATLLAGYDPKVVTSEIISVSGLSPGNYVFRVRAGIPAGESDNSSGFPAIIEGADFVALSISETSNFVEITGTSSVNVTGQVTKPIGAFQVKLHYRGISESDFKEAIATVSGSTSPFNYQVSITDAMVDELGIEYYIEAKDAANQVATTSTKKVLRSSTGANLVVGTFNGTRSSIKIIAFPYDLNSTSASAIFESLGIYNKKTWRLAHYQDGKNVEFQTAGFPAIERGMGFWFNSKTDVNIKAGSGTTGSNDKGTGFQMQLVEGWNQIGNPYPFSIDWSDVLADNPSVSGVGTDLKIYNGAQQNYSSADDLNAFEGAFVHSEEAVMLNVNVSLKNTFNAGRKRESENSRFDLTSSSWQLPFSVHQNGSTLDLAGIGMHPEAKSGKDKFDEMRLPRMNEFLDITFAHPESKFPDFTRDVTTTCEKYEWSFVVESSDATNEVTLKWENQWFGDNEAQMFLLDVESATLINMREQSSIRYSSSSKRNFKIYFNRFETKLSPGVLLLGDVYPNPARDKMNFNLVLPNAEESYSVRISIYDKSGKLIKDIYQSMEGGAHTLQWDLGDNVGNVVPSGLYIIRAGVDGKKEILSQRIVVLH